MIVALENIRSLWNIGAIMRSCEFFGIKEIWLVGYTVAIEQHPKSIALQNWRPVKNSVLVFGSETGGVSAEVLAAAAQIVEIPR